MKKTYLELMEKALSAYSREHIVRYLDEVKTNGLTEHGFPRLTANIGILIAHGRRQDLLPLFVEMMDVCCEMFLRPYVKAANEFSVREIVCCLAELEGAKVLPEETLCRWRESLSQIVAEACYDVIVESETDRITNWAIFGAVSEYARLRFGLGGSMEFVERQLSCQFQWLDENSMYCDHASEHVHQPMVYDIVSRGLFAILLHFGYRGRYCEQMDSCLEKSALLTLRMQSTTGEIPFGGRSNQFLHNEPWLAVLFEYEARRYQKRGDTAMVAAFKSATCRAIAVTEEWLSKKPIRHIKNRFPTETKHGCEKYAYFDKYMITTASFLYAAYLLCDDSIPATPAPDLTSVAFQTTDHFHKVFLKNSGYAVEIDTNADPIHDATGVGRVHFAGAPSTLCLSVPCHSAQRLSVTIPPSPLSLCSGVRENGVWRFVAEGEATLSLTALEASEENATALLRAAFPDGQAVTEKYVVSEEGVQVTLTGAQELAYMLPAFAFDGEAHPEIREEQHALTVTYGGWSCRYTTDGEMVDLGRLCPNRNGYYRAFAAIGEHVLHVNLSFFKEK